MSADYKSCNANDLVAAAACLTEPCTTELEREAIDIVVRVAELKAVGGTDYTSNLKQLLIDANGYRTLRQNQRCAIATYLDWQNAIFNGATFTDNTVNGLKKEARCVECLGKEDKKAVLLFLKCKLNSVDEPE